MDPGIVCQTCGDPFPKKGFPYLCMKCGGIYDLAGPPNFSPPDPRRMGMWRYHRSFALPENLNGCSLGEGGTPLIWEPFGRSRIAVKQEHLNPTGSYKDRGTTILASHLMARKVHSVVEDSSGNAGASLAAYAARAGIHASIFIPESASGPKRKQIEAFGAKIFRIPGPRAEAARAVREAVAKGAIYASHAYQPFGLYGIATIAYEICEQIQTSPGTIITPVGHGGLLWGIIWGFRALLASGRVKTMPFFVGVQANACAPIVKAFKKGSGIFDPCREGNTLAEGVKVTNPSRGKAMLDYLLPDRGSFLGVSETDIQKGHQELAHRGFFVEPTSAIVWNALKSVYNKVPEPIVLILTGSGLKHQFIYP
jgi:threonine synthase